MATTSAQALMEETSPEHRNGAGNGIPNVNAIYRPLDTTGQQIRLLHMVPADAAHLDSVPQWSIRHVELANAPKYRALSYNWDRSELTTMFMNGCAFKIRASLYAFLTIFRERNQAEHIWIDQICINQKSKDEKNHQVAMMQEIYRRAIEVIIWLPRPHITTTLESTTESLNTFDLASFAKNQYWGRTWIVQEILLASRLSVWWGQDTISWGQVESLFRYNTWVELRFFSLARASFFRLKQDNRTSHILEHVKFTMCKDPRDKWYGIQGLLSERHRTVVDYNKSTEEVFADAAIAIMMGSNSWYFLQSVFNLAQGMYVSINRKAELNSWSITPSEAENKFDRAVLSQINFVLKQGDVGTTKEIRREFLVFFRSGHKSPQPFRPLYKRCIDFAKSGKEQRPPLKSKSRKMGIEGGSPGERFLKSGDSRKASYR